MSPKSVLKRPAIIFSFIVFVFVFAFVGKFGLVTEAETNSQASTLVPTMFDPSATITVNDTTDAITHPKAAPSELLLAYVVNSNGDTPAVNLVTGTDAGGNITLRSAIQAATAQPGSHTITFSGAVVSPINLTLGQITVGNAANGNNITITGPGMNSLTVNQTTENRIFSTGTGAVTFLLQDITLNYTGPAVTAYSGGGGAIIAGGAGAATTLINCRISNFQRQIGNGGAISASSSLANHSLTITNSIFTNNRAGGGGGAVSFNSQGGTATITRSIFDNNHTGPVGANTGGDGGAINLSGGGSGGTYLIEKNTFLNNQVENVTGHAGAIMSTNGTATIRYNRFRGNTCANVAFPPLANIVGQAGGATTHVTIANDNWWGVNTGPGANDATALAAGAVMTLTQWLQLRHSGSPSAVLHGGVSALTADILGRNSGGPIAAGNLTGLAAFPSPAATIFGNPQKGTLSAASTQFINGQATATFTAGIVSASCGTGGADATADSQTVNAPVIVQCADLTIAKTNNVVGAAVVGQQWTWTLTATNGGNANAAFTNGQAILTDNLPNSNITYGSPTSNNANVSCSISSNNLTCTAAVAGVTLAPAASFTVTFTATGTAPATNINPRAAGIARIDSGSLIVESNEGNNDASANTVTVSKANTSMSSITDSPDPSVVGQAYTVGFTLNVTAPGSGTPTGTVSVNDGTGGMCTATLPTMNCMLTSTTQGVKTVTLTYDGDSNFNTSSNTTGHLVNKANTSVGIVSSQNPSLTGQSVTFTATANVTAPGAGTPTGNVTFLDNAIAITGCTNVALTGVTAQCTPSPTLALGNHPITAQYNGDTNFNTGSGTLTGNPQVVTNTATWDGSASNEWNTPINWTTNAVPNSTHNVNLPAAGVTNQPSIIFGNLSVVNLTVNAGRTLDLTGGSLTVTGVLTMSGNNITVTGANLLTIGGAGSITRTTGSIIGNVEKIFTATGAFTYPVGTATGHSPVLVNITALTVNPSNLRVRANDGTATGTPPLADATTLDRFWTLTETGNLTANVTFTYLDADVDGNENNYRTIRITSGAVLSIANGAPCPGAGSPCVNPGANTMFVGNLSQFSDWTAGELAPNAATVPIAGRVMVDAGRGAHNAEVQMVDGNGNVRTARTNPFGYFRFEEVEVGQSYVFTIRHKLYQFEPRLITINEDVGEIIFTALPEE